MSGTILGIGPLEFLIVVILVLLVFGPERLPDLMRQAGKGIRKLRDFYVNLSKDLRTELVPFEEEIKVLRDVTQELRHDLDTIREAADIRQIIPPIALDGSVPPGGNGTAAAAATATAPSGATAAAPAAPATLPPAGAPQPAASAPVTAPAAATLAPPPAPATGAKIELADDSPWARLAWLPRSDALDDDNPWAA